MAEFCIRVVDEHHTALNTYSSIFRSILADPLILSVGTVSVLPITNVAIN